MDILGKAYKIFLSRGGKVDNKNIILTPDHIKSLMVKLADLNLNDVVIDTCTGSGGFLMEAMETLINLTKGNDKKINNIKESQLIGFEIDPVLFSLTCSNMFLHGDGRTNLIYGSSLLAESEKDKKILSYIHSLKPTKCIINPPYENGKAFEFTWQAIDFLENNGKLVIIMPSNTLEKNIDLSNTKNKSTEKLLQRCRLEAIIKMPENLFSEQKRTINTSIFIFTKTPHNKNKNVIFYNLSDDGFVSIQHKGKVDIHNTWNGIENEIINCIINNEIIENKSYKQKIYNNDKLFLSKIDSNNNRVKISDIFTVEIDKLKLQSTKNIEGEYHFITGADKWKTHNTFSYDKEALVYCIGAEGSLGRCHYVNGKFTASSLCIVLTQKDSDNYPVNLEYYKIYFDFIKSKLVNDLKTGAAKKTINKKKFENYKIQYIELEKQVECLKRIKLIEAKLNRLEHIKATLYENMDKITHASLV